MTDSLIPPTEKLEWIHFRNQKILSIEVDHSSEEQSLQFLQAFVDEISGQENGSVLFLADLNHAGFLPAVALKWQSQQRLIHSKCARVAVVGAHGVIFIAAQTFLNIARVAGFELGRKIRFFENPDLAKQWLADGETPS